MKPTPSHLLLLTFSLLIFIGLPLLGWGIGQVGSYFEDPARIAYLVVILLLQIFAITYNPQVGRIRDNRKTGVARHRLDLLLIQVFSLAIVFLAPLSDHYSILKMNFGEVGRIIGLILLIPGFTLMQVAEKSLAKQFSVEVTLLENHQLVQDGPYKLIRHPRYLGILIFFTGISLVFQSFLTIFITVILLLVLFWRISVEEALMHQEFGKEWETYCVHSWRLIPYVF